MTTTVAAPTSTVPTTSTTAGGATSTTAPSGLGVGGAGTVNPDGTISDTGGESMIVPGMVLLGVGIALRRTLRQRPT
jgi:hypothetical protein